MKVNRRRFLQGTAAAAATGAFGSSAWAEDPINVASIHDLSGGLDIYGKPMVDAMTLAVEEANAAGGLLGRQIKLINYDTQSNMQLYTQFAQQAALKDKVAVVHGGITSASREVIRPVLDRFKTLYFYNTQYEGGVCDRNQFDTGVTPAQTVEKLVPYAMKKWGKKVYVIAADYNYGQITSQWVKKYVIEMAVKFRRSTSSARCYEFRLDHLKIQAAKPDFVWSALVGGAHILFIASGPRPACAKAAFRWRRPPRRRQRAHRVVARRMQRHAGLLQLLPGPEEQTQRNFCCSFPQTFWRRLSQRHRTCDGNLSRLPYLGGGGQESRQC
jgi:branched-chain amino acid transport system substrate-binding protein